MDQRLGRGRRFVPLFERADVHFGPITLVASTRSISGPGGRAKLEPKMMEVLLCLAERPGALVRRTELLERCWSGISVGDDSLNRAIAGIRRAARSIAGDALQIDTLPGTGYILNVADSGGVAALVLQEAMMEGWRSWQLGLPQPDTSAIARLREALITSPGEAEASALLALVLRHAVEHAEPEDCGRYVEECKVAASTALAAAPRHGNARAALASVPPLFGEWLTRRGEIVTILHDEPENLPALHDLAILEMATGRPSAAVPVIEALMERKPLAAIFHYKRIYHLWAADRIPEMDQIADRALQLWPRHPAIWFARFWSLAFTGRPAQAMQQLSEEALRPAVPAAALMAHAATVSALLQPSDEQKRQSAIQCNVEAAARGPAQSVAAVIHLSGLGAIDEALDAARAYLARQGANAISLRKTQSDPSVTDQHRRVTQMLFLPVTSPLRAAPGFADLCAEIGLEAYWRETGLRPDHAR